MGAAPRRPPALTFESLPARVAECCIRVGRPTSVRRGHVLARQGDDAERCYYVRAGYARVLSTSADGHQILVGFMGPGDVIGQSAAAEHGHRYLATTVAAQPMELVAWRREEALELSQRFPDVHARLDALLLRNSETLIRRLHTVSEGKVQQRVARALLELAARHGKRDATGAAIEPRLRREDLAQLTASTLFTVSRVLAAWQSQGLLTSHRGRVHLNDLPRIAALAADG